MKYSNENILSSVNDRTLAEYINYKQNILIDVHESFDSTDNTVLIEASRILTDDELYYHLQYHQKIFINYLYIQQIDVLCDFCVSYYRVFINKGISVEFFLSLYDLFQKACSKYLNEIDMKSISKVYEFLELNHENIKSLSYEKHNVEDDYLVETLFSFALESKFEEGLALCSPYCKNIDDFNKFFATTINKLMTVVGYEWEIGVISVAQEHKITAYIDDLTNHILEDISQHKEDTKTIIVSNAPNELHKLGLKLISNSLLKSGFKVITLDSELPIPKIEALITKTEPDFIIFSVTLVSNIYDVTKIIKELNFNKIEQSARYKIIVGGKAFEAIRNPIKATLADLYFDDVLDMVDFIKNAE